MDDRSTRRRFLAAAGLTLGFAGCNAPTSDDSTPTPTGRNAQPGLINSTPTSSSVYTSVYREAIGSIALIRVFNADQTTGQGSGFLYDDAHVVTNEHVVGETTEAQVKFTDGNWRTGTVVGTDVYSDLAVIEVDDAPTDPGALPLIEGEIAIGERVVAIGHPFGLSGSVSAGIVSGVDRSLPAANDFRIPDAIQTDAAVNPGNSGGPLMTLDGRVAGVINSGSGDNIGFAISAALMRRVVPSLIETGDYQHSYMGVRLVTVTPLIAEALGLGQTSGVYIDTVVDGSPAEGVLEGSDGETVVDGVRVPTGGDVVVSMGGESIPTQEVLSTYLALATSPGDTVSVGVVRDGRRTTVDLTLGSRPEP